MACLFLQNPSFAQEQGSRTLHQTSPRIPADAASITKGRQIFNTHCAPCHAFAYEIIGPALATVQKRRPLPWLIHFIHHSQQVIESGDEYAVTLYDQYGHSVMPSFETLPFIQNQRTCGYDEAGGERKLSSEKNWPRLLFVAVTG